MQCCDGERVPLNAARGYVGTREPVPWRYEDEERWKARRVLCPHRGTETSHGRALGGCLRRGSQCAAETGALVPWDER